MKTEKIGMRHQGCRSVFDAQWCKPLQTSQVQSDLCKFEPRMRAWLTKLRVLDTTGLRKMCVRRGALSSTYPYWYWDCDSDLFRLSGGPCSRHDPCLVVPSFWPHFLPQYFQMLSTSIGSEESLFAATATQCLSSGCLDVGVERCFCCIDAPVPPTARVPWGSLAARSDRQPESVARKHCALLRSNGANAGRSAENQRTELLPEIVVRDDVFTICHPSDHWPKGGAVRSDQEPSGLPWPRGESRTFTVQHF